MELKHPAMDNDSPSAWADSDESGKSQMQPLSYTAKFEVATWNPITSGQELHLHLVGDSHVILENISFTAAGSETNLLVRPTGMSRTNSSSSPTYPPPASTPRDPRTRRGGATATRSRR